ncbi:cell division protein FtsA [Candidatus Vampirococcus lugosii]|uniref:Cell division protein FtsA n=1 Tax=Candidatus Vampirococcus lugosii TaxID=2789015 RepID=A0ABS5QQS2_9BACT|nr:cell division protein FtsA [Candidatus Vampirococcus lugosii]MBS8122509.1 Cell division ATPase FtsA [Candidatus Vampirococcus lugosii]
MKDIRLIIDIGNGYLKGIVVGNEDGKNILLARDSLKTKGMRKGRILDVDDFVYSIRSLLDSFEKKLGGDYFDDVTIGVSHPEMKIKRLSEQKRIVGDKILQEDVDHLSSLVDDTSGIQNYETIKIMPVKWVIDDETKLKDPLGMEGRKLEIVADVFMIPKNYYNSLLDVCEKLELDLSDVVPNILGSAEVALDFDSKDLGTLLLDIGANQTSYVIYEDGYPVHYGVVPIGGEDVTKDISIGMQVDIKEAEKMKLEVGDIYMDDDIPEQSDNSIDTSFLSDIIAARYEEIFDYINKDLIDLGKDARLPGGINMIGGASKQKNLDKLAKFQFKLATSSGRDNFTGFGEVSNNLSYISCLGVFYWGMKYPGSFSKGLGMGMGFSWLGKIFKYIKDMF